MSIFLISVAAFLATLLGGLFALHLRDRLHLILGFSAGAIIGVAFFDLIPEALELGGEYYLDITSMIGLGFALFLILDRLVLLHSHDDDHGVKSTRGVLGAGSLSVHSFLDGVAIGLAFQVSVAVGIIVAIAVLVHDFSDGINTVSLILKNGGSKQSAVKWLLIDATTPVLGVLSTLFFSVPSGSLGLLLALFAGSFLYIGASDLLPESHHGHPVIWTTVSTLLGMLVLYVAIQLAGI